MRIVLRREVFSLDTFTAFSFNIGTRRIQFSCERPRQKNDRPFHIAKEFGGKNA